MRDGYYYWELRRSVAGLVPRRSLLAPLGKAKTGAVREKGRKSNYHQFDLKDREWKKLERLLNTEEVNSFLEISLRAAACPMPLNLDTWDGLRCPFGCIYCYADARRASLYTAFFDNSKSVGIRHCNPDFYKKRLDAIFYGKESSSNPVSRAVAQRIPMRFGIRFEDFTGAERRTGVALEMLQYLGSLQYPVMINTKSALLGRDPYVRALADNPARAAVHMTLISSDDSILSKLEPGAPKFRARLLAMKQLVQAGVRVVARIEPYIVFLTDSRDAVGEYMEEIREAGIRHITFDTYSHTANLNPGIRNAFERKGFDFERLYLLGCDSQPLGSLLLGEFMRMFQAEGFSCSTFDLGNAPLNSQTICCEVGDWFEEDGFNWGSAVTAARFIMEKSPEPVRWKDFDEMVTTRGRWLSEPLYKSVKALWNMRGNTAYSIDWVPGLVPAGWDPDGVVWKYEPRTDFRRKMLEGLL